jgi:hypothetical protein
MAFLLPDLEKRVWDGILYRVHHFHYCSSRQGVGIERLLYLFILIFGVWPGFLDTLKNRVLYFKAPEQAFNLF